MPRSRLEEVLDVSVAAKIPLYVETRSGRP